MAEEKEEQEEDEDEDENGARCSFQKDTPVITAACRSDRILLQSDLWTRPGRATESRDRMRVEWRWEQGWYKASIRCRVPRFSMI